MSEQSPLRGRFRGELGPRQRERAWQRLADEHFDIVVVGGGVVGAGAALDAATRGLRVALVEARDVASGTSSRSSKMFHGGLRYLEQLEFGLVREALRERELSLRTLAPHLVRPLRFLYPLTHQWERPYVASGLLLYDRLGGARSVPGQHHLTRSAALRVAPGLRRDSLVGGVTYYDTVVDDARHTLTVARTAAHYGAVVRTSTQVVGFVREADRVVGVQVRDSEDGRTATLQADVVINATGVWTDELQALSRLRGRFHVRASKGVHIVVPRDRVASDAALILRTATSVLFVIPWSTNHWIIGTTDTDWSFDLAHPAATRVDIDYLLDQVNRVLVTPLTHDDIDGVYAGLRPLLAGESDVTSKLSREHAVARLAPGLVAIAGGKYTTYRVMACDAVEAALVDLTCRVSPSITDRVPLLGADGYHALRNQTPQLAQQYGVHPDRIEHLLGRYGSLLAQVLELAAADPGLLQPIAEASGYLRVEAVYAATAEAALHLDDILARRTRISIEYPHRGVACAEEVAQLVAPILGWDVDRIHREVDTYTARVDAEVRSQTQPDDHAADALRRVAPEPRPALSQPNPTLQ